MDHRKNFPHARVFQWITVGLTTTCFAVACGQAKNASRPAPDKPQDSAKEQSKPNSLAGLVNVDPGRAEIKTGVSISSDGLTAKASKDLVSASSADDLASGNLKLLGASCGIQLRPILSGAEKTEISAHVFLKGSAADCSDRSKLTDIELTGALNGFRVASLTSKTDNGITGSLICYDSDLAACDASILSLTVNSTALNLKGKSSIVTRIYRNSQIVAKTDFSKITNPIADISLVDKEMKSLIAAEGTDTKNDQQVLVKTVETINGPTYLGILVGTSDLQVLQLDGSLVQQSVTDKTISSVLMVRNQQSPISSLLTPWLTEQKLDSSRAATNAPRAELENALIKSRNVVQSLSPEKLLLETLFGTDPKDPTAFQVVDYELDLPVLKLTVSGLGDTSSAAETKPQDTQSGATSGQGSGSKIATMTNDNKPLGLAAGTNAGIGTTSPSGN